MVVSESFFDSTRRTVVIGSRLARGCVAVEGRLWMGLRFPMVIGVGKRLLDGLGNG